MNEVFEQTSGKVEFKRVWAKSDRWTFKIKPIARLIAKYVGDGKGWIDPFAGENSPAEITNDLNPARPTKFHLEACDFIRHHANGLYKGILFDPPYSYRQITECYDSIGLKASQKDTCSAFYSRVKEPASKIISIGGYAICFGWNSVGFGKDRGFELVEVLIVPHGAHHNDTLVTVERKFQSSLDLNEKLLNG